MTEQRLVSLVTRQFIEDLEPTELAELAQWAAASDTNRDFLETFTNRDRLMGELNRFEHVNSERCYAKFELLMRKDRRSRVNRWTRLVAAAVIVFVVVGIVLINANVKRKKSDSRILPGKDIVLTGKDAAGNIVVETPRSGEHRLTLPDKSSVWLNDSTTIIYSAAFSGHYRTVELYGEAYFEVAPDAVRPFIVKLKDATVEAKGTSFDISSYPGEGGSTTVLVNGTVRIRTARDSTSLLPDEQASVNADSSLAVTKGVQASAVSGWKDGYFIFHRTPLDEVLRQLARWYDVDVENRTNFPDLIWSGKLDRRVPLDSLLNELGKSQNQIQFHLDDRRLIVLPK